MPAIVWQAVDAAATRHRGRRFRRPRLAAYAGCFASRAGATWARWTAAVVLAGLSAVVNFMWLPSYPLWSVLVIAVNVTIIWALTTAPRVTSKAIPRRLPVPSVARPCARAGTL